MNIKKILITVGIVLVLVGLCYSCTIGKYNSLIKMDESVSAQWSQVENQYQRRYDLVPNLVSTVKGYAKHEETVFTEVTNARAAAGGQIKIDSEMLENEEAMANFQKVQDSLGGALQRLLAVTENYPELKANEQFIMLQDQLEGTENRIAVERKKYNEIAREYNTAIRKFPEVFIANMFSFKAKAYFQATQEAQTAPKVEF